MPHTPALSSGYHPASHHSIPAAPCPQVTPPVLHQVDNPQLMAGTFCPLCLSRALLWPCQCVAAPTACPTAPSPPCGAGPLPTGSCRLAFPITGG